MQLDLPYCPIARFREMADAAIRSDPEGQAHFPNHGAKRAFRFQQSGARYRTMSIPILENHRQLPWNRSRRPAEFSILTDRAFMGQPGSSVLIRSVGLRGGKKAALRDHDGWGGPMSVRCPRLSGGARPTTSCVVEFVPVLTYTKVRTILPRLGAMSDRRTRCSLAHRQIDGRAREFRKTAPTNT